MFVGSFGLFNLEAIDFITEKWNIVNKGTPRRVRIFFDDFKTV